MNAFIPNNPTVILRMDEDGRVKAIANNISQEINVVIVRNDDLFKDEAANQPFNTNRPPDPVQVLAHRPAE